MKHLIFGIIGIAVAGCTTRQAVVMENCEEAMAGSAHLEAKHIHLKSLLGIDDAVLADTNRFVLEASNYSQDFKFDEPFGGFVEARVYLDEMTPSCRDVSDGKPHRLRSVELKRELPNATTEEELVAEWQVSCDFIAGFLEVEPPQVCLVDVSKWRRGLGKFTMGGVHSCVVFDLADGQYIDVRLTEPSYAMRRGKIVVVSPGYVKISLIFNRGLCLGGIRQIENEDEKIESELDFGPDCSEKLAASLRGGIVRRAKRVKRIPVLKGGSGTNKVSAVSVPVSSRVNK